MNLCKLTLYQIHRLLWSVYLCLLADLAYNDSVIIGTPINFSLTIEWMSSSQSDLELQYLKFWQYLPLFYKMLWTSMQNLQTKCSYYLQNVCFILFWYKNSRESKIIGVFYDFWRFISYELFVNRGYKCSAGIHRSFKTHKTQDFSNSFEAQIYTQNQLIELSSNMGFYH